MNAQEKQRKEIMDFLHRAATGQVDCTPAQVSAATNFLKATDPAKDVDNGKKAQQKRKAERASGKFQTAPPPRGK